MFGGESGEEVGPRRCPATECTRFGSRDRLHRGRRGLSSERGDKSDPQNR